jgi:hypothetical protein
MMTTNDATHTTFTREAAAVGGAETKAATNTKANNNIVCQEHNKRNNNNIFCKEHNKKRKNSNIVCNQQKSKIWIPFVPTQSKIRILFVTNKKAKIRILFAIVLGHLQQRHWW